jgi:iron-sulfur cluster assembly protein
MLEMTADAATLVCDVTSQADSSAEAGLRIVVDPVHDSLSMGIATAPAPQDAVITRDGARVFVSRPAARRLHKRTLRAELSADRSLFFLDG